MQGLTVQGVSPTRLTPRPNENISVPDEVGRTIVRRNLARRLTESRIAIATAGLGLNPTGLTVRALVRALISSAGLVQAVANLQRKELTPTAAPPSEELKGSPHVVFYVDEAAFIDGEVELDGILTAGYDASVPASIEVEL